MAAAPVVLLRRLPSLSPPLDLAAAVPAAAAAPPPSMTLLAPVARPPVARLLVVSDLPCSRFSGFIRSRCPTPVALHAPREVHVRALGALPIPVSDARGRRAGPAAAVGLLRLGLRRGLFHKNRVAREVRRFPHPCGPVTRGSPVGHFVASCSALGWALLARVGDARGVNGWRAAIGQPAAPRRRSRVVGLYSLRFCSAPHYLAVCNTLAKMKRAKDAIDASPQEK